MHEALCKRSRQVIFYHSLTARYIRIHISPARPTHHSSACERTEISWSFVTPDPLLPAVSSSSLSPPSLSVTHRHTHTDTHTHTLTHTHSLTHTDTYSHTQTLTHTHSHTHTNTHTHTHTHSGAGSGVTDGLIKCCGRSCLIL